MVNRTDSKAYHKPTLTARPSCLCATLNYTHVPRPLIAVWSTNCAPPSTQSHTICWLWSYRSGRLSISYLKAEHPVALRNWNIKWITPTLGPVYFIITAKRYMFRPAKVIIRLVQNVLIEYSCTVENGISYVCYYWVDWLVDSNTDIGGGLTKFMLCKLCILYRLYILCNRTYCT